MAAVVDTDQLQEQAIFIMTHVARVSARMKDGGGQMIVNGDSVADRRDKMAVMWQQMTESEHSE